MIEIRNEQLFHLYNEKISYIINVLPNQQLGHVYFGPSLGTLAPFDQAYLEKKRINRQEPSNFEADNLFTLADRFQELPTYGTSDFREGAVSVFEEETPLYVDFKLVAFHCFEGKNESWRNQPALLCR